MSAPTVLFILKRRSRGVSWIAPRCWRWDPVSPRPVSRWRKRLDEVRHMPWADVILAFVTAQRLGELVLSRIHTRGA